MTYIANNKYLLLPPLYEEGEATVLWDSLDDVEYYELDRSLNEDFDSASTGKSWISLAAEKKNWQEFEGYSYDWNNFQNLDATGLTCENLDFLITSWQVLDDSNATWDDLVKHKAMFTIYRGLGNIVPADGQGLTWQNMDGRNLTWEDSGFFDGNPNALTWLDFSLLTSGEKGLSWRSMDGRHLTWQNSGFLSGSANGLTWKEFEDFPADSKHRLSLKIKIPLYTKKSQYRIRAKFKDCTYSDYFTIDMINHLPRSLKNYTPHCLHVPKLYEDGNANIIFGDFYGAEGFILERSIDNGKFVQIFKGVGKVTNIACSAMHQVIDVDKHFSFTNHIPIGAKTATYRVKAYNSTDSSKYLTSQTVKIEPLYIREDNIVLEGAQNEIVYAQLDTLGMANFKGINITMSYDPNKLEFINTGSEEKYGIKKDAWVSPYKLVSNTAGKLVFKFDKAIAASTNWSGFMVLFAFKAKQAGKHEIKIY